METIILKYKSNDKKAEATLKFILSLGVFEVASDDKSPYNAYFIDKIKKAKKNIKQGKCIEIDVNNVWGSIK